jgi:MFS family permease
MSKTLWMRRDNLAPMAALVILLAGQAMATMDDSILAVAAPSLRADLHASGGDLQLVVVMYMMAVGALVVTGARLGDILGRRRAFVYGVGAFTLASLAGGLAPNVQVLIVARTCQGAAAALMTPQVLSIIQTQFEGQRRARAIGTYSMILAAGVAAGQILGGILVSAHLLAAAWRPALLANVPVGAVLFAAGVGHAVGFSPLTHRLSTLVPPAQAADLSGLVLTADWIGTVLGIASFAGIFLSSAAHGPAGGLATTTDAIATTLLATAACARVAVKASSEPLCTTTQCQAET